MLTLTRPLAWTASKLVATDSPGMCIGLAAVGTVLVALAAHIAIPLPFSPVPLTLQPFAVLLIGMMLSPTMAFATMLLYLGEGAVGLPVFSPLGLGGVAQLFGPTGGYLLSYPLAASVTGWIAGQSRRIPNSFIRGLLAATGAVAVIFLFGATWLATLLHLHPSATLRLAVLPFLPGEAIKILAAATIYRAMLPSRRS